MIKKEKLARRCKEQMVDEIVSRLEKNPNFFITYYMGLSTSDIEGLRRSLRKSQSSYFVVKNSVFKVVLDRIKRPEAASFIASGIGLSVCGEDSIVASKALMAFANSNSKFKVKAAFIDGKLLDEGTIKRMSCLPSKEALLAQVIGGIKSPITGFVMVLSGALRKFVYTVDAIKVKKEKDIK